MQPSRKAPLSRRPPARRLSSATPARQTLELQRISGRGPRTLRASVAIKDAMEILENENKAPVWTPCKVWKSGGVVVVGAGLPVPWAIYSILSPMLESLLDPRASLWPPVRRERSVPLMLPAPNHRCLSGIVRKLRPKSVLTGSAVRLSRGNRKVQDRKLVGNDAPTTRVAAAEKVALFQIGGDAGNAGIFDHEQLPLAISPRTRSSASSQSLSVRWPICSRSGSSSF